MWCPLGRRYLKNTHPCTTTSFCFLQQKHPRIKCDTICLNNARQSALHILIVVLTNIRVSCHSLMAYEEVEAKTKGALMQQRQQQEVSALERPRRRRLSLCICFCPCPCQQCLRVGHHSVRIKKFCSNAASSKSIHVLSKRRGASTWQTYN